MQKRGEMKQEAPKPTGVAKRRALGDISNINNTSGRHDEGGKENVAKKPVLQQHVQPRVSDVPHQSMVEPTIEHNENAMVTTEESGVRPYMQRPSDNIDARDAGNPLLVTEFVDQMYDNFRAAELEFLVNPNYMNQQPNINDKMRAILVDWLVSNIFFLQITMIIISIHLFLSIFDVGGSAYEVQNGAGDFVHNDQLHRPFLGV